MRNKKWRREELEEPATHGVRSKGRYTKMGKGQSPEAKGEWVNLR